MHPARVYRYLATLCVAFLSFAAGCGDPVVVRLQVLPEEVTLARGESVMVRAFYERDMVEEPVGSEGVWKAEPPNIVSISGSGGQVTILGVSNGVAIVTVEASTLKSKVRVSVNAPAITAINIEPPAVNVAAGLQTQLVAMGRLADGDTTPVTHLVEWSSSAPATASIDSDGEVTAHTPGGATITAELDGLMAIGSVTVTQPRLTAITVSPANPDIPRGGSVVLSAMGTFTDGSMRDVSETVMWTSAQPGVASVSIAGIVTGNVVGSTMITARQGNVSGATTVNVVAPVLATITVNPVNPSLAAGQPLQFTATGTLTDTTTVNLTTMVTWSSTAMGVATISNAAGTQGRATSIAAGVTTIRATIGPISGETMLTVTPPVLVSIAVNPGSVSVPLGRTQAFTAMGTMSNGAMMPLTTMVTWTSTMPGIATVSNLAGSQGLATTHAGGPTQIVATLGLISGSATLSVGAPVVDMLAVQPANSSLAIGATRQMRAIATMSDGTMPEITGLVTWGTSMPARATITPAGVARGVSLGATTITATSGMVNGMTTLTVTPIELVSIAVAPAMPSVTAGATQQFTATGRYSDDSMADLTTMATWGSSVPAVATVSNAAGSQGLATTLAGGTTSVTATMNLIVGSASLTSTAVTVASFAPAENATGVRTTAAISFTFTQPMDPALLFTQIMSGPCAGNLQLSRDNFATCLAFTVNQPVMSAGNTVATAVPAVPLLPLSRYRLRATASATAATGIPMTGDVTQAAPFTVASDGDCAAQLVVSQVYGGGGNNGAPIRHDFIELHNPGPTAVDLGGKAIQFISAAGTGAWSVQALPSVQVAPGGYYLIQEAAGAGAQPPLSNPDFTPMSPFAMGATSGKVALTSTTTALTGDCPLGLTLDLVGYGATATCFEGAAPLTAPADNTAGVIRAAAGCADRNVETEWSVVAPAPRNAGSMAQVCICYVNETDLQAEVDFCNLQFPQLTNHAAPHVLDVFGRVYEAGVTEAAGASPTVRTSFAFGVAESSPTTWTWVDGIFNQAVGNDDEYRAQLMFPMAGDFDYTSRATRDGTNWTVCDIDGAGSNFQLRFDQFQTGSATITP